MDTVPTSACPACGAAIPADAPQGLCPRCALGGAVAPTDTAPARGEPPPLAAVRAAFPQLEILGLLGAGGMGFVFQARQPHLDRLVALKLLPIPLAADPHFSERFLREGRLLARLAHPGIVSVHDFGQAGGFAYLLMEYVDGVNLRQAMDAGRFTPAEALAVVPKICEALQYAHERGVLHRDIKPENLLLDAQGRVKIADFGIAKLVGDPAHGGLLTASGARLGTPHYMAPEQVEQPAAVDHRADIYSLGVVFYEMLTGELPLGRFAPPSQKTPLDARVDEIVLRALAKERELRQQSAGEVKTQVEGLASEGRVSEGRVTTSPGSERPGAAGLAGARPSEGGGGQRFEYRSPRTLWGLPLLHIARGIDPATGREREARGIVAIGGRATGVLAIGGLARGVFAFGGVAFGLFAFGGLAFGGAVLGGLALGLFSFGGLAVGLILALGGLAVGWSAFGGLVVAQQGIGGFMAAGQRLPDTGLAGTLIRWLPWLWIPIVPLSLVPGLVAVWAHRKLDAPPGGPRPNPWPHRLFWLVAALVLVPLLVLLAGLLASHSRMASGLVLTLGLVAGVVLYHATRPEPSATSPPAAWNPWPRRVFLALLAVVVLPLMLLVIGLLLPRLARHAAQAAQAERAARAAATAEMGGLPENLPAGEPGAAALKWHHAWKRLQEEKNKASVGVVAPRGPEVLAAERDLAVAESEFKGDPVIAARARLAYAEAMLAITERMFANGRTTEAEVDAAKLAVVQTKAAVPASASGTSPSLVGLPETLTEEQARHPANFLWHQAWRRWQQVTGRVAAGELAWDAPDVLAARRDLDLREAEARGDTRLAAQARLAYAEAVRTRTRQRFAAGLATADEVNSAELGVTNARSTMPPAELNGPSFEVREYLRRMLMDPVAGQAWNLDFWTNEKSSPTPRYYLRFRAPRADMAAMLARGGFVEGGEPAPNPSAPPWWRAGPGMEWQLHTRTGKPTGCAIEELWTHRLTDEVFYRRECQ